MKIYYTKHAELKFGYHKELGWDFSRRQINKIVRTPHKPRPGYRGTKIVSSPIDKTHDLRVVYVEVNVIITVVTFYPIKKGRYE